MRPWTNLFAAAIFPVALAGCVTTQTGPPTGEPSTPTNIIDPSIKTPDPQKVVNDDQSARRLGDINGALYEYYALHRKMPASLEELKTLSDLDRPLNLIAPGGQAYVYESDGLWAPDQVMCIVVFDPMVTADAKRWCLMMSRPKINGTIGSEVKLIPEPIKNYRPAGE